LPVPCTLQLNFETDKAGTVDMDRTKNPSLADCEAELNLLQVKHCVGNIFAEKRCRDARRKYWGFTRRGTNRHLPVRGKGYFVLNDTKGTMAHNTYD